MTTPDPATPDPASPRNPHAGEPFTTSDEDIAAAVLDVSIPTLMLFRNGAVVATKVGALSKSQLTAFLDSNL